MAIVTVSGEPGCRTEELARNAAQRLRFEFVSEARLNGLIREEFGETPIPDRAWIPAATSVLARAAIDHSLVVAAVGSESLFVNVPGTLRVFTMGRAAWRTGTVMLDQRLDRASAVDVLRGLDAAFRRQRKERCGRSGSASHEFHLVINAEIFEPDQAAGLIAEAANLLGIAGYGCLSASAEAQIQFQARLQLARHNIVPAGKATLKRKPFGHPSEELFANLLDFYRLAWEYEPRSFPLQWDKQGNVIEAFTPDFYLPEYDLYVELTTMKQALVTRKNRKVKLLRAIYPHVNIRVFYQKDFQDLVSKHDLADRMPTL